jgi:hypothetical protein
MTNALGKGGFSSDQPIFAQDAGDDDHQPVIPETVCQSVVLRLFNT